MSSPRTIETAQASGLCTFTILLGGEELSRTYQVISVAVERELNRIPTAKLVIIDGDAASQDFALSNEDLLIPGAEIEIKAGYHSDETTIFQGLVTKHSLKIRSNQSLLIIECKDKASKLTLARKSKFFYEKKDSEIIKEIVSNAGLSAAIDDTNFTFPELIQYQASDWDFIITRAQHNGLVCKIENGNLNFVKPNFEGSEVETVAFGATLLDFDGEIDMRTQFNKVTAYAWNSKDQEISEIEGKDAAVNLNGNLSSGDLGDVFGFDNYELRHGGNLPTEQLQAWADSTVMFNQLAKIRGRARFQGTPAIVPDTIIQLDGLGDRFNGKAYVSGVLHQILEGNWTVDAQFGMDAKWFAERVNINPTPAAGLFAATHGLQLGVVSQLEEDPTGENRIMVKIPIVDGNEQGIWARVSTLDAGDNRGSFFLPELGDEVVLGFVNNNPNEPIVLGMLHSSGKPAPITAADDNFIKGFITKSEMKILFDDEKKVLSIETPAGKKISLDEDQSYILLEDENSNKITMNADGISIESGKDLILKATGDIKMEGINIEQAASAQWKTEGSAGVEMSSSGTAVIKGSLVQIN